MVKILLLLGAILGGALGWWLGDQIGIMTAYFLSVIGTGLGMYVARWFSRQYLP
jgi:hypothetical protein